MEVTVDKTPTSPKLHKAIQGNLQGESGILSGVCCNFTPNNLSRFFHALISKFQAQFCPQSDKLESEAKLNHYFIWYLSHFSSLPCLTMYKYCEEKISLYVSFLGIILAVFSLDFTLENIETLANKNCSPQYHTQRITTIMLQVLTINIIIIMINYLMNPD